MSSSKVRRFLYPAKFKKLVIVHAEENGNREAARNDEEIPTESTSDESDSDSLTDSDSSE